MFDNSKLKIKRAQEHIDELNRLIDFFIKTDFCAISSETDPKTGSYTLSFSVTKSLPDDIALVIGDAVHNLRGALDLLLYEIIADESTHFPFYPDRESLVASKRYRFIEKAAPEVARYIADTVKPYETGNRALWGLHRLDIIDKHHLLIPTLQVTGITIFDAVANNNVVIKDQHIAIEGIGRINAIRGPGKLHIKSYGKPEISILFGPETPFHGQPVLEVLIMRVVDIQKIVTAFEKAGFGRRSTIKT